MKPPKDNRRARYREKHRQQIRNNQNANNARDRERERRLRGAGALELRYGTDTVLTGQELRCPRFKWIDTRGKIHEEWWESVEQLIIRLQKEGLC